MDKFAYGALSDGREVTAYRLRNAGGCELVVLDYGVTLVSLTMPARDGKLVDVILGYDTAKEYEQNGGFFGACIGRVCNRIGGSSFTLDGVKYDLVPSEGKNQLHGGTQGFDRRFFDVAEVENGLVFTRLSPDGEEGFPGNVQVKITVTLSDDNVLTFDYAADTDKATPVSLTNHSYFNLGGEGDMLDHTLKIYASNFTPVDPESIPTGEIAPVAGTPMDFTAGKVVGDDIGADMEQMKLVGGFDHNFVLDSTEDWKPAAELWCPRTGIAMKVCTTAPAMQFYSGNFITAKVGKGGAPLAPRYGLCLETQIHPDAVNQPAFPSAFLPAGGHYASRTSYCFTVR